MEKTARKAFLEDYAAWQERLLTHFSGSATNEQREYAFKLISRFLFLFFLQHQGLLGNNRYYLHDKLAQCQAAGIPYPRFLIWLLQALDTPSHQRPVRPILGHVPYLRLFPESPLPQGDGVTIPDQPFQEILNRLQWFTFDLDEQNEEKRGEVTPALLGHLVETHIALKSPNARKATGTFYTPEAICTFLSKSTCYPMIQRRFEELTGRSPAGKIPAGQEEAFLDGLLETMDAQEAGLLLFVILPTMSILDPAVGAGNFLVGVLRLMARVYLKIFEQIEHKHELQHPALLQMLQQADATPGGRDFFVKRRVLASNLFGVDLQQEPLEITRMRLWLALLSQVPAATSPEPLPPLLFCLPRGNSLVGVDRITERERLQLAQYPRYGACVLISLYGRQAGDRERSAAILARIGACRAEAYGYLGAILTERIATTSKARKGRKKVTFT